MARIAVDPNYNSPTFPRATAAADIFVKEDVQALAAAVSTHTHDGVGKGLAIAATGIPAGSITSAMIADGTIAAADLAANSVTTAKIADASVTNAKLGSDTARDNLLTNGGFEIWQRGVGPFTGSALIADKWRSVPSGTDTASVSREPTNVDNSLAAAVIVFTLGNGAGNSRIWQGLVAGDNLEQLRNKTVSLSIRVRTTTANAVRAFISPDGMTTLTYGTYHTGGGSYETLTATLALGAATDVRIGVALSASATVYLDNAMLVLGSQPADYVPMHPADDVARCLRYYEIVGETPFSVQISGYASAGPQNIYGSFRWVRKAVTPTVTIAGSWTLTNTGAKPGAYGTPGVEGGVFYVASTAAGQVAANNASATDRIILESNP